MTAIRLLDANPVWLEGPDGLAIKHEQVISGLQMDALRDARNDSVQRACGEMERVASVPTSVIELWLRQGFDAVNAPLTDVVKKLKQDGLEYFLATDKRV